MCSWPTTPRRRRPNEPLQFAQVSADDYAVEIARYVLAGVLFYRDAASDRARGVDLLRQVRKTWSEHQMHASELPIADTLIAREEARSGDRDRAIPIMRKAVDVMFARGQIAYVLIAVGLLVQGLLDHSADGDVADAESLIDRLAAAPADGSLLRDAWLLRLRALLARARGDDAYRELRDRYREMAASHGYEGHMAWAEAMP